MSTDIYGKSNDNPVDVYPVAGKTRAGKFNAEYKYIIYIYMYINVYGRRRRRRRKRAASTRMSIAL